MFENYFANFNVNGYLPVAYQWSVGRLAVEGKVIVHEREEGTLQQRNVSLGDMVTTGAHGWSVGTVQ